MRLIDADVLENTYCEDCGVKYGGAKCKCNEDCPVIAILHDAPTVDAVPAVHARWKELSAYRDDDGYILRDYECSSCSGIIMKVPDSFEHDLPRYCCMCGAKMDGGEDYGNDT